MLGTVRRRANDIFELRVTHSLLPKPYYSTHDSANDAEVYAEKLVTKLNRGEVPAELVAPENTGPTKSISSLLTEYRREHTGIASSDRPLVEFLERSLAINLQDVTVRWTDDWIREMQDERLTPGSDAPWGL